MKKGILVFAAAAIAATSTPAHAESLRKGIGRIVNQAQTNAAHVAGYAGDAVNRGVNSAEKAVRDPVGYILSRPERLFSEVCAAPIRRYERILRVNANGRWKRLPPQLIRVLQPHYSNVNLANVAYAEGMRTSNGQAQAIGRQIYFPRGINLMNRGDLFWMLHELEHTQQYAGARNGTSGKLCEYAAKAVGNGFSHDSIDMERAADRKAHYLINIAMSAMAVPRFAPPRPVQRFALPQQASRFGNAFGQRCATPVGIFGPGPATPLGAPCHAMTPRGPVHGRVIQ